MSKRLWPAAIVLQFSGLIFGQGIPVPAAHARGVHFENVSRLSSGQKEQLSSEIQRLETHDAGVAALYANIAQATQAAYADEGFWNAKVDVNLDPRGSGFIVTVRARDEGQSYRLRRLTWSGVKAFSEGDLADLVPVRPGKPLVRSRLSEGIEAVRRLYLGGGYLSFVAVPEVKMDERSGTVDVRISVDEGGVFTVQSFDVIGLNTAMRERLLQAWPFKPGDVYRGENVENFVSANAALLPTAGSADVVCRTVDLTNHTVEFVLDFRPQPLACNGETQVQVTRQSLNVIESNR